MNEQIDKDMSAALAQRLKDEGRMIRSTVCPTTWTPEDADLHERVAFNTGRV